MTNISNNQYLSLFLEDIKYICLLQNSSNLIYQELLQHNPRTPSLGKESKQNAMVLFEKLIHEKYLHDDFLNNIKVLQGIEMKYEYKRMLQLVKQTVEEEIKLPLPFVEEFSKIKMESNEARQNAKTQNNQDIFLPYFKKIITLSQQQANYIKPNQDHYTTLLQTFEEDITIDQLNEYFMQIKEILKQIQPSPLLRKDPYFHPNQQDIQDICIEICKDFGFNFDAGCIGSVEHPFMINIGLHDIRININFSNDLLDIILSMIHELGHGLYEQNIKETFENTNLQNGVSLGIHESQSKTLEDIIGRSYEFCYYLYNKLHKYNITYWKSPEEIYNDINHISPSLKRLESDEVNYDKHIILRYELEQDLINNKVDPSQIRMLRNDKMNEYFNIMPQDDATGWLQDGHWSESFGYFPTYILGKIYGHQIYSYFLKENPNRQEDVKQGKFEALFNRYKENIRQYGSLYKPHELIERINGEAITITYYKNYIENKFLKR